MEIERKRLKTKSFSSECQELFNWEIELTQIQLDLKEYFREQNDLADERRIDTN